MGNAWSCSRVICLVHHLWYLPTNVAAGCTAEIPINNAATEFRAVPSSKRLHFCPEAFRRSCLVDLLLQRRVVFLPASWPDSFFLCRSTQSIVRFHFKRIQLLAVVAQIGDGRDGTKTSTGA